ncbi:MAG: signal recognition particle-docking protein FtsY [Acidobacteriota bacterium]|nr:signal recognition particle-docking protein FtsY [Acidobacteriota bacterium]
MNPSTPKERPGYFERLKSALQATRRELSRRMDELLGPRESPISPDQLEELEYLLIGADLGVETSESLVAKIRQSSRGKRPISSGQARRLLASELLELFEVPGWQEEWAARPHVVLVVGVNGVGKTTTIGKLAHRYARAGRSTIVAASDTFRAAAVEQLSVWCRRSGADLVMQRGGTDPAAVLHDALQAAKARNKDVLLADTAGRLHTKRNLMEEVKKMARVAGRLVPGAPHDVYLVLDATTGQNGLIQAREFLTALGVTGIVVTKLDGTAKGGIVAAIASQLKIPIRFVGTGEGLEDLAPFDRQTFVDSILT